MSRFGVLIVPGSVNLQAVDFPKNDDPYFRYLMLPDSSLNKCISWLERILMRVLLLGLEEI